MEQSYLVTMELIILFIRIGEYCGTELPGDNGTIVSASPSMYLSFTSDSSQSKIFYSETFYCLIGLYVRLYVCKR